MTYRTFNIYSFAVDNIYNGIDNVVYGAINKVVAGNASDRVYFSSRIIDDNNENDVEYEYDDGGNNIVYGDIYRIVFDLMIEL